MKRRKLFLPLITTAFGLSSGSLSAQTNWRADRLRKILLVSISLASGALFGQNNENQALVERAWRSNDGRTVLAKGQFVSTDSVHVQRAADNAPLKIPFKALNREDAIWAIGNLDVIFNDDFNLGAKSVSQSVNKYERETGRYAVSISGYTYANNYFRGSGHIVPIMESVKESGRVVEVELRSLKGGGVAAIELYTITGQGAYKRIRDIKVGVFMFDGNGSKLRMQTKVLEDYAGWVVVARSVNTGKIVKSVASMTHLIDYVTRQIPEKSDFSSDIDALRTQLLAAMNEN